MKRRHFTLNPQDAQSFALEVQRFKQKHNLERKVLAKILDVGDSTIGMWFRFACNPRIITVEHVYKRMEMFEKGELPIKKFPKANPAYLKDMPTIQLKPSDHVKFGILIAMKKNEHDRMHGFFPPEVREKIRNNNLEAHPVLKAVLWLSIINLTLLALHAFFMFFTPTAHAAEPFPQAVEWGAMTKPEQWNRRWADYKPEELIPAPKYDIKQLTEHTMKELVSQRDAAWAPAIKELTAKLFYSTRYCGSYNLDAGENVKGSKHCAIDIKMPLDTPIHAIKGGKVKSVTTDDIYGLHVIVESAWKGESVMVMYAHMGKANVKAGRRVREGQVLGIVGLTGKTSGAHLHLQVNDKRGNPINPAPLMAK